MREESSSSGSFGTQLQTGTLSGTAWQNVLREGGKSGVAFLAAHWVPPTQGVSIRLAPVATHHYIIRDNRFSCSWPLVCLPLFIYCRHSH